MSEHEQARAEMIEARGWVIEAERWLTPSYVSHRRKLWEIWHASVKRFNETK